MVASCHPDRAYCAKGLCRKCYDAKWKRDKRATDPEWKAKIYAATKQWNRDHPEYERERSKRRYIENPEYSKRLTRAWWKQHPEKRKEYRKALKERNPEAYRIKVRSYVKARKARKKGAVICDFTHKQWETMKEHHNFQCFYCKETPEQLTQDHMIPLSRGGAHTEANIVPACMICNTRKGARTTEEFHALEAAS